MSGILENIPTGMDVHGRDWACLDCGGVYCKDEDATHADLPDYCPNCGDTPGWRNRKTGRKVPDYSTDGGRTLQTGTDRPEDWPDTFSLAGEGPSCPHAMTWDSDEGRYVCIHGCGRTEDEPPESSIEAYRKFLEKKEQRSHDTETEQ